jgi:hypothetical protein
MIKVREKNKIRKICSKLRWDSSSHHFIFVPKKSIDPAGTFDPFYAWSSDTYADIDSKYYRLTFGDLVEAIRIPVEDIPRRILELESHKRKYEVACSIAVLHKRLELGGQL